MTSTAAPPASQPAPPVRLGDRFVKLWLAATTSALGIGLAAIATPLLIASRTSDPTTVAAASGVAWLPWLLFALPGGVLVDRLDRKRVMVVIDWARVVLAAVLALAVSTGHASIVLIYVVLFLVNTGEIVFRAASQAMLPAVVPLAGLERANGWLTGGFVVMQQMVAGPLGGFLFVLAAGIPFWANAGTYAVSAVLIGSVAGSYRAAPVTAADVGSGGVADSAGSVDAAAAEAAAAGTGGAADPASSWRRMRAEVAEGFRWLMHQRLLRTMAILIGLLNVTLFAALGIFVLLAKQRLHLGSVGYGLLFTCMAAGGVLGSVFGDRLIRTVTASWTIRVGLLVEAAFHLVLATSLNPYVVGFAMFAFGVHGTLWNIASNSLRQRLTPPEMNGRVGSTYLFVAAGGNSLGALLGGVLAARFGLPSTYWAGFAMALVVAATTWHVFDRKSVTAAYAAQTPVLSGV